MSIVTCDVVEGGAIASSSMFAGITTMLTDRINARSALVWAISALLIDASATASDFASIEPVVTVVERATAYDTWSSQANMGWVVRERATAKDFAFNTPEQTIVELIDADDDVVIERATTVTESAVAADTALYTANVPALVVERARATDLLFGFNDFVLTEQIEALATALPSVTTLTSVTETALASDEALVESALDNVLVTTAYASDELVVQMDSTMVLIERIVARDRALFEMFGQGWVMNSENFGMSRYTALPVETLAVLAGRVLALGPAGLYELAGDTDDGAPIDASITTGRTMLGDAHKKRIPDVFMTGTFGGATQLTVGVYGTLKGSYTYTAATRDADSPRGTRFKLGKGLASTYWKFTIANKDGSDFNINTMTADVAPSTTRRI